MSIIHKATIKKWGNSPALRLSSAIMKSAKLSVGQAVKIHIERGKIVIKPSIQSEFVLDDLIAQISKKNLHSEVDFGNPVGREWSITRIKSYPFEIVFTNGNSQSVVFADHLKSLDWRVRKTKLKSKLSSETMAIVKLKIKALLCL